MRRVIGNARAERWRAGMVYLLPAIALPMSLLGVVVQPVLDVGRARAALVRAQDRLQRAQRAEDALAALGPAQGLSEWEETARCLRELIPAELTALEVYSWTRIAAYSAGFRLDSVFVDEAPTDLNLVVADGTVRQRNARISGIANPAQVLDLSEELRALGLPHAVIALTLARLDESQDAFRADLILGFFQRAPALPTTAVDEDSTAP